MTQYPIVGIGVTEAADALRDSTADVQQALPGVRLPFPQLDVVRDIGLTQTSPNSRFEHGRGGGDMVSSSSYGVRIPVAPPEMAVFRAPTGPPHAP